MTLPAPQKRFTPREYLLSEATAEVKHEYHAGEILAMSGGTYRHSRIIINVLGEIRARLKGKPCFALEGNMRVRLAAEDRYVYPDGSVVCGEPQFDPEDENQTTIINPKVVIEVLSDSTEAYDRGAKFTAYRELKFLEEYLVVSQHRPLVESFVRQGDGTWSLAWWSGREAVVSLRSLGIELPLSEIFAGLTFAAEGGAA